MSVWVVSIIAGEEVSRGDGIVGGVVWVGVACGGVACGGVLGGGVVWQMSRGGWSSRRSCRAGRRGHAPSLHCMDKFVRIGCDKFVRIGCDKFVRIGCGKFVRIG